MIQIQILNEAQFCATFWDLSLVEQVMLFHLSYMARLWSLVIGSKCEITKKLSENRKFSTEKWKFWIFKKLFLDHWDKLHNLQTKVFGHTSLFWKPYFRY